MKEIIVVTGGAGYIGSHTIVDLLENTDYYLFIIDNFETSFESVIDNISSIVGKSVFEKRVLKIINFDFRNSDFAQLNIDTDEFSILGIIHFAGYKAVAESVENPFKYYENNLKSTLNILKWMQMVGIENLIFSSTASLYGTSNEGEKKKEDNEIQVCEIQNPYAKSKFFIEEILKDIANSPTNLQSKKLNVIVLRYFNPVGNHPSGLLGENPSKKPENLMPVILNHLEGKIPHLEIYGQDYPTRDGTCVRDFIHVSDLATGHTKALQYLIVKSSNDQFWKWEIEEGRRFEIFNLGTGKGTSVLELIHAMQNEFDGKIKYVFANKRKGDVSSLIADPSKANDILNWFPQFGIEDICRHTKIYFIKKN